MLGLYIKFAPKHRPEIYPEQPVHDSDFKRRSSAEVVAAAEGDDADEEEQHSDVTAVATSVSPEPVSNPRRPTRRETDSPMSRTGS